MHKPQLLADVRASLGEGPVWDSRSKSLYWVDIIEKRLFVMQPESDSSQYRTLHFNQSICAVAPKKDGGFIAAAENGFYTLDDAGGELTPVYDPESDRPGNRFNDGKCDPQGRFWAGTMHHEQILGAGALYRLDQDLNCSKMVDGVTISNGLAWSSDSTVLYYIDTPTRQVDAFTFDSSTGELSDRRTVIDFCDEEGFPDGMTIDAEGMLWIAHWGGWQVSRWNPVSGKCLDRIKVPAAQVTSCTFGGTDLKTLYITTAAIGLSEADHREQPHAGGLFAVQMNVRGTDTHPFGAYI
ncbi:SMP-30/gluconolactonase/LRE family protein [Paenibacillus turpanensis]|uniref:SMP-30/gluconolactonase/LRE family protein n=1 Tax=Paenibacillus turpanensis TaxID=2689078 RepID=UPI00140A54C1